MAQKIKVIVAKGARDDLEEILEYLRADSPHTAAKIVTQLLERLKRLPRFPTSGRMIPELAEASFREIIAGPYRIMYRLETKRLVILRVVHGKRFFGEDY